MWKLILFSLLFCNFGQSIWLPEVKQDNQITDGPNEKIKCYMCNSLDEGVACDETNTGELMDCPLSNSIGCRITQGSGGETNFYERSCADEDHVGCTSNSVDGVNDHECICQGDGCNQNWETAGETGETTPAPSGGKQCYRCSTIDGGECSDFVIGENVTCEAPMDKGCFISSEGINYIRDCADLSENNCIDNEMGHRCTCTGDLCNIDFHAAGDDHSTVPGEALQCYVCKSGQGDAPCDEYQSGDLSECSEDYNVGCLISKTKIGDSGISLYTRDCTDRSAEPCRDYQGDEDNAIVHECVCEGKGCNKDWSTAGDTGDVTTDTPIINCYVCKTEPGSTPCNEENPGPLESCPPENTVGCIISQSRDETSGEDLYLRNCTDRSPYECRDFQGDEGGDYHECICQGDGCNENWKNAGEPTTPDGDNLNCYECSTAKGENCTDTVIGTEVKCQQPSDKGCFISKEPGENGNMDLFIRGCADTDVFHCENELNIHSCFCKDNLCNLDFETAGEGNTSPPEEKIKCYKCDSLFDSCTDENPGVETDCDKKTGCSISEDSPEEISMDVSNYVFKYVPWPHREVYFQVKSPHDVHLALAPDEKYEEGVLEDDVYEFVIGGWGNQKSVIRRGNQGVELANAETIDILSGDEYRGFWISTAQVDGKLELKLGKAGDKNALMTGLDENPVEIKYLGLASWPDVTASYKNVKPVEKSVLTRYCGRNEDFGCEFRTDGDLEIKYCNCKDQLCNLNWVEAGSTDNPPDTTTPAKPTDTTTSAKPTDTTTPVNGGLQCFQCNSLEGDCDSSHFGKVVNCPTDQGCLLSYESIAGKDNEYYRDCATGGEKKCERVESGTSVLRFCICDGNLCNESWDSAGSTSAPPTDRPTEPQTTQKPTQGTDNPTTSAPSSAARANVQFSLSVCLFFIFSLLH